MVRKWVVVLGVLLFAFARPLFADDFKIGVVDVNKILNESKEGADAKNKMKVRYDELQKKLSDKQESLKKMKDDIEKQKILLGKEKLKEKEDELDKELVEFRKIVAESEKEMRDTESAYTQEILSKIKGTVEKIVKEKGLNLVVDRSGGIVYADDQLDITPEVLEKLDKEYESGGNKSE